MPSTQSPVRSHFPGFWLIDHPCLWAVIDDFGTCVPVNNFVFANWVDQGWDEYRYQ